MNARTELDTLIDLEHAAHHARRRPEDAERDIVRALCGPWWRRCWRPAKVQRIRLQFQAIVAARDAAAKRLASRPPSRLSPTQTDALVRQIMAGKPLERLIRDMGLDSEQAVAARRGAHYVLGYMAKTTGKPAPEPDPTAETVLAEAQVAAADIPAALPMGEFPPPDRA